MGQPGHFLAVSLLMVTACATTQSLTRVGEAVEVVTQTPTNLHCAFVAPVTAEWGGNFQTYQTNSVNAYNDIRNQAANLGATHLVIVNADAQDPSGWAAAFGAEQCENCVLVQGQAYRCE